MKTLCAALVLCLLGHSVASPLSAIVRRHDRSDDRYLELGQKYPSVTRLGGGTATLVEPHWLLTAGHVAAGMTPFDRTVEFNGKVFEIEGIVTHPGWRRQSGPESVDLALVKLKQPVTEVEPVSLYGGDDEAGMEIVFVGPGMTGDGQTGPVADDGRFRGATNTVQRTMEKWVVFSFDAPPGGTDLEGISGPGDSGGPALIEKDGKTWVIGVSSANDDAGATGPCRYGSTEYYARVSTAGDWIRSTIDVPLPEAQQVVEPVKIESGSWPDGRAAEIAAAFFEAWTRESDDAMSEFEEQFRSDNALRARPVSDRVQAWRGYRGEWGSLAALECIEGSQHDLYVLVRAEKTTVDHVFRFVLEPDEPRRLTGIEISPTTRRKD